MAAQGSRFVASPTVAQAREAPRFLATITFNSRTRAAGFQNSFKLNIRRTASVGGSRRKTVQVSSLGDRTSSSTGGDASSNTKGKAGSAVPSSNYVVPLDNSSSCITRPLTEILRDLNKRIPDNIIVKQPDNTQPAFIPWYHANRMLSFYAPDGEISMVQALLKELRGQFLTYVRSRDIKPLNLNNDQQVPLPLDPLMTRNLLPFNILFGWCGEIRDVIFSDTGSVTVVYRVTVRGSDGETHRESTGTVSSATNGQSVDPVAAAEEIAFCKACARFGLGLYLYHEE